MKIFTLKTVDNISSKGEIVCLEFNAAFNSFGHITAVSVPTHVFLAYLNQYLHNILSKPLTTFSHRSEVRGDGSHAYYCTKLNLFTKILI